MDAAGAGGLVEYQTFRLGRVYVGVSGHTAFARAVAAELDPITSDGSNSPQLMFHFLDSIPSDSALPGREFDGRQMRVSLSWEEGACPVAYVAAMLPPYYNGMPSLVFKSIHPAYIDQFQHLAGSFFSQVFNGLVQALSLSANQSFLHAAAVEKGGNRIAVIAKGGMGKTGSLLRLVVNHGWRYLSDDWAILDDSSVLQLSYKSIQVYPRNLTGLNDGDGFLFKDRSILDRMTWNARR